MRSQASPRSTSRDSDQNIDQGTLIRVSLRRKCPSPEAASSRQTSDLLSPTCFGFSVTSQTELAESFDSCSSPTANVGQNSISYLARMHESYLTHNSKTLKVQTTSEAKAFFATDSKVKRTNGLLQGRHTAEKQESNIINCASLGRGVGSLRNIFQNRHC